ncbi:LysR substrate-binding domain-containing protein [Oceanibacterium hippocampi]|nr:LysR substrate-binding domain-containing protein [Oceanibacterium hippocampi]
MRINLHHIRYFIVVAEELHFGRAAARLNMAQPALSQRIQSLEAELEVKLIDRSKRQIELTRAGQVFLKRSRQMLIDFDESVLVTQRTHRGETDQLVVGTIPAGMGGTLFREILPAFQRSHPQVSVIVRSLSTARQIELLHTGQIDVGLLRLPVSDPRLTLQAISSDTLVVAMREDHPLASLDKVSLAAVAEEPQIIFPRVLAPDFYDFIIGLLKATSAPFTIAHEAEHLEMHLGLVAGGLGVAVVPATRDTYYRGVVYRPLEEQDIYVETALAFLRGRETKFIRAFVDIAGDIVQARMAENPDS